MLISGCASHPQIAVETRLFVDSAGREVEIPVQIDKVVPSGSFAQMILYTLCPEKLLGLANVTSRGGPV